MKTRNSDTVTRFIAPAFGFLIFLLASPPLAHASEGDWRKKWEETVEAAKKEGQLVIYHSNVYDRLFEEFEKKYPEIKLTKVMLRGPELSQRVMAEKRAGKHLADLALGGAWTMLSVFHKAGLLDPLKPELILPEVADESKWWEGRHPFVDPEGSYIFAFNGELFLTTAYNKNLVNPAEFRSYGDLLKPKWKGKMVAVDLAVRSTGATLAFFYHTPELGPKFLRKLFGEMELTMSRDARQITDWVATGKYAISLLGPVGWLNMPDAQRAGLPVAWFGSGSFAEGFPLSSGSGNVSLFKNRPHANAVRLALASVEGGANRLSKVLSQICRWPRLHEDRHPKG